MRKVWPKNKILGARVNGSDWLKKGTTVSDCIYLSAKNHDFKSLNIKNKNFHIIGSAHNFKEINEIEISTNIECQGVYRETLRVENNIKVYPNPVEDGNLNINLGFIKETKSVIQIFDIAGNLIKRGFATANFGVGATSPLVSLGILREFGEMIKPKNFIYCRII